MTHCINEDLYLKLESMSKQIITSNARRYCKSINMSFDDAIQEAKIALIKSCSKYNYNNSYGGIYNFISRSIRNHFLKMKSATQTRCRSPHIVIKEDNKNKIVPVPFVLHPEDSKMDYMDTFQSDFIGPEEYFSRDEGFEICKTIQRSLENVLDEREITILRCKIDPPYDFRIMMMENFERKPTIRLICKYTGLQKNAVDWSIRKIRQVAIDIITTQFKEYIKPELISLYSENVL